MRFPGDMKTAGKTVDNIGVVNENTDYGTSVDDAVVAAAAASGMVAKTGHDISDLSGWVMQAWFMLADAINRASSTAPAKAQ